MAKKYNSLVFGGVKGPVFVYLIENWLQDSQKSISMLGTLVFYQS